MAPLFRCDIYLPRAQNIRELRWGNGSHVCTFHHSRARIPRVEMAYSNIPNYTVVGRDRYQIEFNTETTANPNIAKSFGISDESATVSNP